MAYNCNICNVHCPSDYQLTHHLRGQYGKERKYSSSYRHISKNKPPRITIPRSNSKTGQVAATNRSGPAPLGVCYIWWNRGNSDKGMSGTYKRSITTAYSLSSPTTKTTPQDDNDNNDFCKVIDDGILICLPSQMKRLRDNKRNIVVSTEIILCKTDSPDKGNEEEKEPTTSEKLASICCKPASSKPRTKEERNNSKYPEVYRDLFRRKRDINLLIKDGMVVWEFAYNVKVIEAIKIYIKGRAWNPNMGGRKGCWTAPIECLPDCIDLYKHMGRTASDELKKRAEKIMKSYGDSSASDAIKLSIDIYLNSTSSVGSIDATFLYDTEIVSAFKMLPPTQRSYDPASKVWTVDLFALPSLIDILIPLGYNATKRLKTISNLTKLVDDLVYDDQDLEAYQRQNKTTTDDTMNDLTATFEEVIDLTEDSDDDGSSSSSSNNINNMLSKFAAENADESNKLESVLKSLVSLVGQKNDSNSPTIDVSSCGTFLRPKIEESSTSSYNRRIPRFDNEFDHDDDFDNDDYIHVYDDDIRDELDTCI